MFYSLRSRLMVVFSILLIVPLTTVIFILSRESSALIRSSIETSTSQTIDQFASHVVTLLTQVEDIGTQVMSNRITQEWTALQLNPESSVEERVLAKQKLREYFSSYAVNNSNGITLSAFTDQTGGLWTQDKDYILTEWHSQYRQYGRRWTNAHKDRDQADQILTGRDVNSFLLPLVHLQSLREIGFVKINYPTGVLRDAIEKIGFGKTGKVYLLTQDGTSVLGQDLTENRDVLRNGLSQLEQRFEGKTSGVFPIEQNDVTYLLFFRRLPVQDWIIVGEVPEKELYQQISDTTRMLLLLSVLLLVAVIVVAFLLSFGITKPLSAMARAMKHVERGEFGRARQKMPEARAGHSEIGYVTRTFENMTERLRYLIETEFETNLRRKNAEYKALLLQITPHFYYNTLEIISGLAAAKREELVMDATEALGKMMRYSLDLGSDIVMVKEELDYIRDYLFILQLRYEDHLHVAMEEDPAAGEWTIAKFILQPLIENAVKYSLEKEGKAGISLATRVVEDRLSLTVTDNGIGMPQELVDSLVAEVRSGESIRILDSGGHSIGLRNVLARCRLFYGEQFTLQVESKLGEGTAITLQLPLVRS
ncbi:histidine kinase [Paenibacillus darwinianus]|uniref:histidine kinase n=1 Tax=Paenibacillus darwinianus TaxID=1380763 RepID=A0A9W5S101_9BACL|nr:histidine kinase [Paenibacillus darwinianus]EXX85169.1 histidine kinase [Paenibacillus darwinianus]EXX87341.1 histidine kinase [Paenibacillus darwinianus]EXX87485.1 histidine kinase [Paenibacillus darwinianus]